MFFYILANLKWGHCILVYFFRFIQKININSIVTPLNSRDTRLIQRDTG